MKSKNIEFNPNKLVPEIISEDPDKAKISQLYPGAMKVGDVFDAETGFMKGHGHCIRRKLTERGGVIFTIHYTDGTIKEWEWFD